eukprot:PITA_25756
MASWLEFACTKNTVEYEGLLQGLKKAIGMNVKNLKVFEYDEQILEFLHYEKKFKSAVIDEREHDKLMNEREVEEKDQPNVIPKSVVRMEHLYDVHDKFKKPTNCKTHSSSMKYEMDVFAWKYEDQKAFDTTIVQHVIALEKEAKPYRKKLRKMHPSLEPLVKKELNKMLDAKIIFPVRDTHWVANLVLVRKKNGDIKLCIDFRNLNKASQKDNYPVPSMEHIL